MDRDWDGSRLRFPFAAGITSASEGEIRVVDAFERWVVFYDCDARVIPNDGPAQALHDYADRFIERANAGEAKRTYENDSRVARIADVRRVELRDGGAGLAFVITVGDKRGAIPGFVHFDRGGSRPAERRDGEVKGSSCHGLLRLTPNPAREGRYDLLLEDAPKLGRTAIQQLINHELKAQAELRNARFRRQASGTEVKTRLVIELDTRRSQAMADAFDRGTFAPIELLDTSVDPIFDDDAEFETRGKRLLVRVVAGPGGWQAAIDRLKGRAAAAGYERMKIRWTPPASSRPIPTEIATDLADIGTALFAKRELVRVVNPLPDCTHLLNDELVQAMIAIF